MFVMVLENVLQNLSRREKNVQRLSMDSLLNVYKCMLLSSQDFFFFFSISLSFSFFVGPYTRPVAKKKISNGSLLITEHNQTI